MDPAIKVVPQPEGIQTPLYIHQRANIYRMEQLEKTKQVQLDPDTHMITNVGILGDPPGTGKTKTILGLIARDRMPWKNPLVDCSQQICSNLDGSIRIIRKETFGAIGVNLVTVPLSIFEQWEKELRDTKLSYKMVADRASITDLERYQVVVCTINMYNDVVRKYGEFVFKRFIYDEMDSAYIPNMAKIRAGFIWCVSATFGSVLEEIRRSRKVHCLKQIFHNILSFEYSREELLNTITVCSSQRERDLTPINVPVLHKYYHIVQAPVVQELDQYIEPSLKEMIEAGDIRGAIKHLGGEEDDSNLADLIRRRAQHAVSEAERKVGEYKGRQQEEWKQRLDRAVQVLADIDARIARIEMDNCVLCTLPMKSPVLYNCCQHVTCLGCLSRWKQLNHTCPFCRTDNFGITYLKSHDHALPQEEKKEEVKLPPTNFDHLIGVIQPGKKVLLFAGYDQQFKEILAHLRKHNITGATLSGSVTARQNILDSYTKGNLQVLILNSRMNGAGLNLQVTTDVVMWHSMPQNLTTQLVARAVRYGQKGEVTVHKFFPESEDGKDPRKKKDDE